MWDDTLASQGSPRHYSPVPNNSPASENNLPFLSRVEFPGCDVLMILTQELRGHQKLERLTDAVCIFHLSRVGIIHERSSWHDAGGAEYCHLRETLHHLLARTLRLMMQDSSSLQAATTAFITQSLLTTDKYLQPVQSNHRILASCVVIKLSSFYPLSKEVWKHICDGESLIRMTFPGMWAPAMSEYFSIFLITVT